MSTVKGQPVSNLGKAISTFLGNTELAVALAAVLAHASKKSRISYREIDEMINGAAEDVLLLGNEWRLLLPVRTIKSAAWEDRLLLCEPGELYEVPNIARCLVEEANRTGCWDPGYAITKLFKEMGEPASERMPKLVEELEKQRHDYRINAVQIKEICNELDIGDRVDALIAELKASGVMSPKLGSFAEVSRAGSPLYELNPSLFLKKGEKG